MFSDDIFPKIWCTFILLPLKGMKIIWDNFVNVCILSKCMYINMLSWPFCFSICWSAFFFWMKTRDYSRTGFGSLCNNWVYATTLLAWKQDEELFLFKKLRHLLCLSRDCENGVTAHSPTQSSTATISLQCYSFSSSSYFCTAKWYWFFPLFWWFLLTIKVFAYHEDQ